MMARRATLANEVTSKALPEPAPPRLPLAQRRGEGRAGKAGISFYVPLAAARQLRFMSLKMDQTLQALMEEALDDLFTKYGEHRLVRAPK